VWLCRGRARSFRRSFLECLVPRSPAGNTFPDLWFATIVCVAVMRAVGRGDRRRRTMRNDPWCFGRWMRKQLICAPQRAALHHSGGGIFLKTRRRLCLLLAYLMRNTIQSFIWDGTRFMRPGGHQPNGSARTDQYYVCARHLDEVSGLKADKYDVEIIELDSARVVSNACAGGSIFYHTPDVWWCKPICDCP